MKEQLCPVSDEMFRAMIENSMDAIVLSDRNAKFTYISPSVRSILGYTPDELIGTYTADIIHADDQFGQLELLTADADGRPPHITARIRVRHKDGSWRWIDAVIVVRLSDPEIASIITNFRDVTAQKKAEEALQRYNVTLENKVEERTRQLQESNIALEGFIHKASHDLQSPVRILAGYASLLRREYEQKFDQEGIQMLDTMVARTKYMSQLVSDMLSFSRGSHLPMRQSEINCTQMVNDISDRIATANAGKYNHAVVDVQNLGYTYGDANMLSQVWTHLIGNAMKFSGHQQQPVIEVGRRDMEDHAVFFVRDNGVGFDMQKASCLFEIFKKLHSAEYEGSGIGLALSKNIVTRHGGKIWADAEEDKGATFYFSLPKR